MADTLQEWIGRQQQASDEVSLAAIKRLGTQWHDGADADEGHERHESRAQEPNVRGPDGASSFS